MIKAITIFFLALTHRLGLCWVLHKDRRNEESWRSFCPVIDKIILNLLYEDKEKRKRRWERIGQKIKKQ